MDDKMDEVPPASVLPPAPPSVVGQPEDMDEDKVFQEVHGRKYIKGQKKGKAMHSEADGFVLKGKVHHLIYPGHVTKEQIKERLKVAGLAIDHMDGDEMLILGQ